MTTPAVTPNPNPYAEFGGVPVDAPTSTPTPTAQPQGTPSSPSTTNPYAEFGGIAIPDENEKSAPKFAPYNAAFGRYTTPENYEKWASTPPKSGPNARPGEYEAWQGANTHGGPKETLTNAAKTTGEAGLAFGTAMGVAAIPEVLPSVLMHTTEGVKALGAWASAYPIQAYMLYQVVKELIPGAKKAMGLVKGIPEAE